MAKDLTEALARYITTLNKLRIKKKDKDKKTNKKTYTRKKVKPSPRNTKLKIKDKKTYSRPKPEPKSPSTSTPKVPSSATAKTKLGRLKNQLTNKAKTTSKTIKKGVKKTKQFVRTKRFFSRVRPETPSAKTTRAIKGTKAIQKGLKIGKNVGRLSKIGKGLRTLGLGYAADWAADQVVDRSFRAISGKNKMSLKEFRTERDKKINSIGKKNKLKTWKDPYMGPKQPEITSDDSPKTKKPKKTKTRPTIKKAKAEPRKSTTENTSRKEWEKKTRNSPARKSGAFTSDQLWEAQKRHREWKKKNKRN